MSCFPSCILFFALLVLTVHQSLASARRPKTKGVAAPEQHASGSEPDILVAAGEAIKASPTQVTDALVAGLIEAVLVLGAFGAASAFLRRRSSKKTAHALAAGATAVPRASPPAAVGPPKAWTTRVTRVDVQEAMPPAAGGRSREDLASAPLPVGKGRAIRRPPDTTFLVTAVRSGHASSLPALLDQAASRARTRAQTPEELEAACAQLLLSSLRACATERQFKSGLMAFEHFKGEVGQGCQDLWSMLLYTSVESGDLSRCPLAYDKLWAVGAPKGYDHVNMVKYHAEGRDRDGLQRMLDGLKARGRPLDGLSRNKCIQACVSAGVMDLAELLGADDVCAQEADVVTYNTLMKGFVKANQLDRCMAVRRRMEAKAVVPSAVTYGILLEACVLMKDLDEARRVAHTMLGSKASLNAVHCTALLKGLTSADLVDEAAEFLAKMSARPGTEPDLISYTTVLRAYGDRGREKDALRLLEEMVHRVRLQPDEIAFHTVLDACCHGPCPTAEGMDAIFEKLIELGLRPSTATCSIMLKAMAHARAFESAWTFLQKAGERFGEVAQRPRLFLQLGQACLKADHHTLAVEIYRQMLDLRRWNIEEADAWVGQQMIRTCMGSDGRDTARKLVAEAQKAGVGLKPLKAALHQLGDPSDVREA